MYLSLIYFKTIQTENVLLCRFVDPNTLHIPLKFQHRIPSQLKVTLILSNSAD